MDLLVSYLYTAYLLYRPSAMSEIYKPYQNYVKYILKFTGYNSFNGDMMRMGKRNFAFNDDMRFGKRGKFKPIT